MEEIESQQLENTSPFEKLLTHDNSKSTQQPTYGMESRSSNERFIYNTDINKSQFDKGLIWGVDVDSNNTASNLEDYRSKNQSNWFKAGAGTLRAGVKVVAEVAKIPGYLVGIPMAVGKTLDEGVDVMTNNAWIRAINQINTDINDEILPVYVKKAVREGDIWDNISSIDFYATEGADGVGFMASMFVPGAALKAMSVGSNLYKGSLKTLSMLNKGSQYEKLAKAARTAEQLGLSASKFDVGAATIGNTLLESFAEAGGAIDAFNKTEEEFVKNRMELDNMSESEARQAFKIQKGELGKNMLISNFVLLLGPNAIQSSMIWGKNSSKFITKPITTKEWIGNRGKNILGATISEGFIEEAGQSTAEHYFSEKAAANKLKKGMFNDWDPKGLVDAYLHTVTTTEGQKAMFLGALLGGTMSSIHGHSEDKQNAKNSKKLNTLIEPYYNSLKSILEEDNFQRNEQGDIIFENDKPVVDKSKVLRKMKTLTTLSQNFEKYDQALLTGNVKEMNSLRNQAIRELILPYAMQGELGIDALKEHLKTIIQAEDIQELTNPKELEERKKNIIKYAEDVSNKFQNYTEISENMFNIKNENATEEQKKEFFNALTSSYVLKELQRNQILTELEDINKKLKAFSYADNLYSTEVTPEEITDNLENKSDVYKSLKEDKQIVEELLKELEKDIVENNFDNDKINKAFDEKYFNTSNTPEQQLINQDPQKDKKQEELLNQQIEKIKNPNNFKSVKEFDDFIKTVSNLINPMDIEVARQELIQKLEQDKLEKERLNKELNQQLGLNPQPTTQVPSTNHIGKHTITTQDQSTDEVTIEGDQISDNEINPLEAVQVVEEQPTTIPGGKNGGSSVISLNTKTGDFIRDAAGKIVKVFQDMFNYERIRRNKLKDKVQFGLGDANDKIKSILKQLKTNVISKEDKDYLIDNLPISVTMTSPDGKNTVKSFINKSNGTEAYNNNDRPLRVKIVDALIENKGSFENIQGIVAKQYGGKLTLDYQDGSKSLKDSNIFRKDDGSKMTEKEIIEYFKNNTYYVNHKGQLVSTKTQLPTKEFEPTIKRQSKGDIYIIVKRPNGESFPLKLNNTRISENKANALISLLKLYMNVARLDNKQEELNDVEKALEDSILQPFKTFIELNLPKEEFDALQSELSIIQDYIDKKEVVGLDTLINLVVHSQNNNPISKFYFNKDGLVLGTLMDKIEPQIVDAYPQYQNLAGFAYYTVNNLNNLNELQKRALNRYIQYKKSNILIKLTENDNGLFNNDNYIKHLLGLNNNEPLLSTNAFEDGNLFTGYSNIVLAHEVINTKPQPKQKDAVIVETPPVTYQPPVTNDLQSQIDDVEIKISSKKTNKYNIKLLGTNEYVSRDLMELAYKNDSGNNSKIGGGGQTLDRIIERGGYSKDELLNLLKSELENNSQSVRNSQNNSVSLQEPITNKDLNDSLQPLKPAEELTTTEKIMRIQKLMISGVTSAKENMALKALKVTDVAKVDSVYSKYKDKIEAEMAKLNTKCNK